MQMQFYRLPRRYLYGTEWEMNFWDAVYYLADRDGGTFQVTAQEMSVLMSGQSGTGSRAHEVARQYFSDLRQQAVANGTLVDATPDEGIAIESPEEAGDPFRRTHRVGPGAFYRLTVPDYGEVRGTILKPVGYVVQGWLGVIEPAIPKRLLNFLLTRPLVHRDDPRTTRPPAWPDRGACLVEFRARVRETRDRRMGRRSVVRAFELLRRYGIVEERADGGVIVYHYVFDLPPGDMVEGLDVCYTRHAAQDLERADQARELLRLAHLPTSAFGRVFADLAGFATDEQIAVLRRKAYGHRDRSYRNNKWAVIVASARTELVQTWRRPVRQRDAVRRLRSNTLRGRLAEMRTLTGRLVFDEDLEKLHVVSARLVLRTFSPDWQVLAGGREERQVGIALYTAIGEPVPEATRRFAVSSALAEGTYPTDFSAVFARLLSRQAFDVQVTVDEPAAWLRVALHLELGVQARYDLE